ncbi:MAG TPA: competence/damage-inducible protein A [Mycobacteriales bacterium]|nr:competence/damage-inducible protein A [Mycobacteriales bacterium]
MTGPTAVVVAVGDELLAGDIANGNAQWLSARLAAAGVPVTRHVVVGDDEQRIADAVLAGLDEGPVVVVTGGLGPTQDDLTREALARAAGVPLVRDEAAAAPLVERFAAMGADVAQLNLRQADLPAGAAPIANPLGTAPGIDLELRGGVVFALPGVPHEMRGMVESTVVPRLATLSPPPATVAVRILHTAGVGESSIAARLADVVTRTQRDGGPTIAFLASGGQTRVKVTAVADTAARADAAADAVAGEIRALLGVDCYGEGDTTIAAAVVAALTERGETLAVAESLTAGLVSAAIASVPGASAVLLGGITAYATDAKQALLDVPADVLREHGAVSGATAQAMAEGVRARFGATWGIATSGVAGPDPQEGKPPGTVCFGLAPAGAAAGRQLALPDGGRQWIRDLSTNLVLDMLRRAILSGR